MKAKKIALYPPHVLKKKPLCMKIKKKKIKKYSLIKKSIFNFKKMICK